MEHRWPTQSSPWRALSVFRLANSSCARSFHGYKTTIMDAELRRVRHAVHAAKQRGVLFDIGCGYNPVWMAFVTNLSPGHDCSLTAAEHCTRHGAGSFNWTVAEQCWAEGLKPDCISTDSAPPPIPVAMQRKIMMKTHTRAEFCELTPAVCARRSCQSGPAPTPGHAMTCPLA